ncbi:hypothetical protein FJTKL_12208 [Diaporthe vaccinii]|uniref:Fungal N-terminal domain-containing protein n=1 Tax=Diaporthe vaccinii TaxID=105482 RepID=A0ABR4EEM2_9PEZI
MHDVPERLGSLESDLKQQIQVAEDIQNLVSGMSPALDSSSIDSLRAILDDYTSKMANLLQILDSVSSESHDGFFKRSWNALRALDKKNAMLSCCDQLAQKRSLLSIWFGKANMDLSHQVRDITEEGRDQIALLSRQVEANSTKIDAHQIELSRSIQATEINSNEVRVLATQQGSGRQEILAAVHETSSEIRNLGDDWQSLGTTMQEFRDILESNRELSRTEMVILFFTRSFGYTFTMRSIARDIGSPKLPGSFLPSSYADTME